MRTYGLVPNAGMILPPRRRGRRNAMTRVGETVIVVDSYWGAASGPGSDPADDICGSPAPLVDGIKPAEIKVKPKPMR